MWREYGSSIQMFNYKMNALSFREKTMSIMASIRWFSWEDE